ncbi:MAG: ParB N-terminal domain-containing protein [Desulfurococcales archaeon]|nr:ParB N-terminal domain-containing protein [Desulfurococcales archaeon]MCE4629594.1 ParB N-terminal domain-containing protein [Desulfurococcales archaeon]
MRPRLELLELSALIPHEQVMPPRLEEIQTRILQDKFLTKPIIVDEKTLIVVDGHHRLTALKRIGARRAPVLFIDYTRDIDRLQVMVPPKNIARYRSSTEELIASITNRGGTVGMEPRVRIEVQERGFLLEHLGRSLLPPKTTIHYTWAKNYYSLVPLSLLY